MNRLEYFMNKVEEKYKCEIMYADYSKTNVMVFSFSIKNLNVYMTFYADRLNKVLSSVVSYSLFNSAAQAIYEYASHYFNKDMLDYINGKETKVQSC